MSLHNKALQADKTYKVARWGVGSAQAAGAPIWEVVEAYLKSTSTLKSHTPNVPRLIGVSSNPGIVHTL